MRRFTSVLTMILVLLIATVVIGCSNGDQPQNQGQPQGQQENEYATGDLKTTYPLTVVDDTGASVTIPAKPERIVSLLPSSTEILCALGQEPIAVTQWDDYPADVKEKAEYVFQDALNPSLEQIVNLQPDLIMYWKTVSEEDISKVKSLGIPIVVYEASNIDGVYENIEAIGRIIDRGQKADDIIKKMQAKEKSIEEKIAKVSAEQKRKVWLEVDSSLYTAGSGTFLDEVITRAGGLNIAQDIQGWGQFNSEQVIVRNPDVIIETYSYMDPSAIENIKKRQGWKDIEAIKNNQVFSLYNDIISRQGPRIIDGLEQTAKLIYPELFEE